MGRLNTNQKHRKRRRRRRERDRRWMARGVEAGHHRVTGYRRFKKLFGEPDGEMPSDVKDYADHVFKSGYRVLDAQLTGGQRSGSTGVIIVERAANDG